MFRRSLFAGALLGLMAVSFQPLAAAQLDAVGKTTSPLVGSWKFTLNPTTTTPPIPAATPGLITFTSDGTAIETDGLEVAPRPGASTTTPVTYGTPGHGAWGPGPDATGYAVSVVSLAVSPNGALHSTNTYLFLLNLDSTGNQFSGTFGLSETLPGGQTVTISGNVTGEKITAPLLP